MRASGADSPTGSTAEIEEVSGNITVPEIAHDTEEDEYVVCIGVPLLRFLVPLDF